VPVFVDARSALGKLLDKVTTDARELVPGLWDVGFLEVDGGDAELSWKKEGRELHLSLSRPIYIRAHQREELKRAVKMLAKSHPPYVFTHTLPPIF
jgi:hypothetical protein